MNKFNYECIKNLGHIKYPKGLVVVTNKVEVMIAILRPKEIDYRHFWIFTYYQIFVKILRAIAKPFDHVDHVDKE